MKKKIKKTKQKSFFFEDYKESEILNEKNEKKIKISLNRVTFLFFIFFSLIFVSSTKIIYLSLSPEKKLFLQKNKKDFSISRSDIIDRNGAILARNIIVYRAGIRPQFIKDNMSDNYGQYLSRENRIEIAKACFDFIKFRTNLDLEGWNNQDIFSH